MLRRRPIARMAVRTTAVVGTAAVVGGHMANKQAAAAQAQQAPRAGTRAGAGGPGCRSSRYDRTAHPVGRAEGFRCPDRG